MYRRASAGCKYFDRLETRSPKAREAAADGGRSPSTSRTLNATRRDLRASCKTSAGKNQFQEALARLPVTRKSTSPSAKELPRSAAERDSVEKLGALVSQARGLLHTTNDTLSLKPHDGACTVAPRAKCFELEIPRPLPAFPRPACRCPSRTCDSRHDWGRLEWTTSPSSLRAPVSAAWDLRAFGIARVFRSRPK